MTWNVNLFFHVKFRGVKNDLFDQAVIFLLISNKSLSVTSGKAIMEDAKIMQTKAKNQDGYFDSLHLVTLHTHLKIVLTGIEVAYLFKADHSYRPR